MAGGLLNIISHGQNNVILTGNPQKTFFRVTYSQYTNFGLQKFRIDFEGSRDLRLLEPSTFTFKIPRHADLLMDTYLAVRLPDIWSPIFNPCDFTGNHWAPYEFRWIRDIGTNLIKEITLTCGSYILQKYSGEYLAAMVDRDFSAEKKELFNRMTGNVPELNNPGMAYSRQNAYPSAYYSGSTEGAEPSIRGRMLYIPINYVFTLDNRCAFPLCALQYNELNITVTLRSIQELFQVRDVFDSPNNFPYVQPDFNAQQFAMYAFLQTPPPDLTIGLANAYSIRANSWDADIHLISTFCFLSDEERRKFAMETHYYLVKDVFEYTFHNFVGTAKHKLTSSGMVSSWMWYLQRNDVNMRNEWSNYTNWAYDHLPMDAYPAPKSAPSGAIGPGINPNGYSSGIYITGNYATQNQKDILETMAIVLGGVYRENMFESGIYNYVEKYVRTKGSAKDGLYCYNFCLNTDPTEYQPSGAINLSKFRNIELELTTHVPPYDTANMSVQTIFDSNGTPIGTTKSNWTLYEYSYNMKVFEERYNIMYIIGGNCGMMNAR
jgi:hypothetical protein